MRVLWVLSSLEEHKKPPDTSQQVLAAVKSEDRALRSNRRVCKAFGFQQKTEWGLKAPKLQVARSEPHSKHRPTREIPPFESQPPV